MRTVQLGRTGLQTSEIGFGGSRIGGVFAGKNSTRQSLELLRSALDQGITFYDTADMYSQGESESLIGTAFRGSRSQVVLATKGGFCLPARRSMVKRIKPLLRPIVQALGLKRARLPAGFSGALSQDFSPSYLARALEASLRRLRTDHIDLYQLHSPGQEFVRSATFEDALQALEGFKAQGKIRHYGIATEIPEDAPSCLAVPGISTVQLGFGLLDLQALDSGTLTTAQSRGLGIIARGCLGGGLLKDGLDEEQLKQLSPKWPQVLALRSFSRDAGRSLSEVALQFCRQTPGISVTLVGMHAARHLHECLRYLQGPELGAGHYDVLRSLGRVNLAAAAGAAR